MRITAGVDVGSTYSKAAVVSDTDELLGTGMIRTGFKLEEAAARALQDALNEAETDREDLAYVATTGYGRNRIGFRDVQATALTAQAWGSRFFFPGTRTVLDVGGQTMKALRLDQGGMVRSFRLNDKCAAGTGAFLEKAARYLGYSLEEIGPLVESSQEPVSISGVCAVFAESEVINHVSNGETPADIMHGAMRSLIEKSVRLMKQVQLESEVTLVGGIMRFPTMVQVMQEHLKEHLPEDANVPPGEMVQFTGAIGAAVLARRRLEKLESEGQAPAA